MYRYLYENVRQLKNDCLKVPSRISLLFCSMFIFRRTFFTILVLITWETKCPTQIIIIIYINTNSENVIGESVEVFMYILRRVVARGASGAKIKIYFIV